MIKHNEESERIKRQYFGYLREARGCSEASVDAAAKAIGRFEVFHTLAKLGRQLCKTPEQMKAWSQNLGHDSVLTTLSSYGEVPVERQAQLIAALSHSPMSISPDAELEEGARLIRMGLAKIKH